MYLEDSSISFAGHVPIFLLINYMVTCVKHNVPPASVDFLDRNYRNKFIQILIPRNDGHRPTLWSNFSLLAIELMSLRHRWIQSFIP